MRLIKKNLSFLLYEVNFVVKNTVNFEVLDILIEGKC